MYSALSAGNSFVVLCLATGFWPVTPDVLICRPNKCGEQVGEAVHILTEMFFSDKNKAVCQNGFSMDGTRGAAKKTFEIECTAEGKLITDPPNLFADGGCKQIFRDASEVPTVAQSEIANFKPQLKYGDSLNYKCEYGY